MLLMGNYGLIGLEALILSTVGLSPPKSCLPLAPSPPNKNTMVMIGNRRRRAYLRRDGEGGKNEKQKHRRGGDNDNDRGLEFLRTWDANQSGRTGPAVLPLDVIDLLRDSRGWEGLGA